MFVRNYFSHFDPYFLFYKGSTNVMHSTGFPGQILSWVDTCAMLGGIILLINYLFNRKKLAAEKRGVDGIWFKVLIVSILLGMLPAAVTSDNPHALRFLVAWPFVMILSGLLWSKIMDWGKLFGVTFVVVAILFSSLFLYDYFHGYRDRSKGMFVYLLKEEAEAAKDPTDWAKIIAQFYWSDMHVRYYMMYYGKDKCMQSYEHWSNISQWYKSQLRKQGEPIRGE
ncbi:MAG: hypothetical protein HQL25_00455 [Candidatus Omnitrophica bacterium]|nr:hypothetical protein [Candidatus Omnitrophota bacterium]